MNGPQPNEKHPMKGFPQVSFIKNYCTNPNVIIGDYTYYDDPDGPQCFFDNILYHFDFIGDKLIIGKYCAIARKTTLYKSKSRPPPQHKEIKTKLKKAKSQSNNLIKHLFQI